QPSSPSIFRLSMGRSTRPKLLLHQRAHPGLHLAGPWHILHSTESMGRLRGRVHRPGPAAGALGGRVVIPTFHPAYLLRSPSHKKECWADIQLAMAELGLPRPG
ncbi:MAG TPA: hypothetical protein ENJ09_08770, partial [Planctomycetes bacterium]|nr:hypothetical protein [Planctomycetota bacterium]